MENLRIQQISGKRELREFIRLSHKLHKNHVNWVPPIYSEEKNYFNHSKNHGYKYCSTVEVLARINDEIVGRIMGIINHRYNVARNEKTARFSHFDCINNPAVSAGLLEFVEKWATERGMDKIIGPMGMYYHNPIGFLIDGFNEKPSFSANFNFDYIIPFLQSAGYTSEADLVEYEVKIPEEFPKYYRNIKGRALNSKKLQIANISKKKHIRNYILPVLNLMNETYKDILGYSQLDEEEMREIAGEFIPLLDPRLLVIAEYENKIAGFIIAIPSLNEGIIAAKGRLFPFGFLKIMKAAKRTKQLDLLLGAVKPRFQGLGIDAVMGIHLMEKAREMGFQTIDSHLELESNLKVRAEMEKMGGTILKKYRVFKKELK